MYPAKTLANTPTPLPDLRFEEMPLCFPEKTSKHYQIDSPPTCNDVSTATTTTFSADVYTPAATETIIVATACTISTIESSFTWYFFGSEERIHSDPSFSPVSQSDCHRWERQRRDLKLGHLIRSRPGGQTFTTRNAIEEKWKFADTVYLSTRNAILTNTTLSFNAVTGTAQHAFDPVLRCKPLKGHCVSDQYIYTFRPFNPKCAATAKPLLPNATVFKHNLGDRNVFQIPRLDIAFSSLYPCPNRISSCYKQYPALLCSKTNFVVALNANNTSFPQPQKSTNLGEENRHTQFANVMSQTVTSLALNMEHTFRTLQDQMLKLNCRNARVQLTNLRATQYVNPSAALSVILNKPAYATMGPSTLQEIACVKVSATLKPSLWVGDRLASRPIFHVEFHNTTREAQLTRGGYLRWKLRDFMPRNPGFTIFTIKGKTFPFLNGSLQDKHTPNVLTLGLPSKDLPPLVDEPDSEILAQMFDSIPSIGLDYLHQTVEAIQAITSTHLAANGINREALLRFTDSPITPLENKNFLASLHETFFTPYPLVQTLFKWATAFWVSTATLGALFLIVATINRNCMRACKKPANNPPTKP